ncbi:MAG: hemolysin family protein [Acidimicrobiales bacterium]
MRTGFSGVDAVLVVIIVVLVAVSAGLALAETSLTRMSRARAMSLASDSRRGSSTLVRLMEHPERFLNPVLLLELVCQLVAASLVGVVAEHLFGPLGVLLGIVFEVVVIFILGEAIPKNWAIRHPTRSALLAAPLVTTVTRFPPVRLLAGILIGLANLVLRHGGAAQGPFVTEKELLAMADVAREGAVIESEEAALIHAIISFGDTVVREVMVPRPDMVTARAEDKVGGVIDVAMAAGFSRIPVYGSTIDDVVGIAYTKDLTRAEHDGRRDELVRSVVRQAHFVPETKAVAALMREMQDHKYHLAMVVDEYGGTAGLVTLEDLIEELVGEIVDEFDVEEPVFVPLANGEYRVNARMPMDELNELLHAALPEGDWDTVGGLMLSLLGHVATEGEAVEAHGFRLLAERVQGRRIGRIRVARLGAVEGAGVVEGAEPAAHDAQVGAD